MIESYAYVIIEEGLKEGFLKGKEEELKEGLKAGGMKGLLEGIKIFLGFEGLR